MSNNPDDATRPTPGRVGRWSGAAVLVTCVPMAVALAVPGQTGIPGHSGTIYDTARWLLLVALAAAAATLLVTRRPGVAQMAATAGAVLAVQLIGTGLVALKHWRPAAGMTGIGQANLSLVQGLAAALTVAAAAALAACITALRHVRTTPTPTHTAGRVLAAAAGALVMAAVPFALGAGNPDTTDITSLGAYGLLYALPWGTALAASGWLPRPAAIVAAGTVAASALLTTASHSMIPVANPVAGLLPAAVLAATIATLTATRVTAVNPDHVPVAHRG